MTATHATPVCSSPPHYWELEQVSGNQAPGVCKKCGAERVFSPPLTFEWTLTQSITGQVRQDRYESHALLADEVAG